MNMTITRLHVVLVQYLNQLHHKVEVVLGVNLLNQEHNVGVFHTAKERHLTLDHVLLLDTSNIAVKGKSQDAGRRHE